MTEQEVDLSDMPPVVCPKCGELTVPEAIKMMPNKTFQIKCSNCGKFTMLPKDEHYDELLQYCLSKGILTEEDLNAKPKPTGGKRKSKKKRKKKEVEDIEEDFEDSDFEDFEESEEDEESLETRILREILAEEGKLKKYQKKHLLDWARLKTLDPNEVHSLLVGLGVTDETAKKIATAYSYALKKEKLKKKRYKEAVDQIYKSVTPDVSDFDSIDEDPRISISSRRRGVTTIPPVRSYSYSPPPPPPRSGLGSSVSEIIALIKALKEEFGTGLSDDSLKKEIEALKEQLRDLTFSMELKKRDEEIARLRAALEQVSFEGKPKEIQELEIKRQTLESIADRAESLMSNFLEFLKSQSMLSRGFVPQMTATEDEKKNAIEKLKAAAKGVKS